MSFDPFAHPSELMEIDEPESVARFRRWFDTIPTVRGWTLIEAQTTAGRTMAPLYHVPDLGVDLEALAEAHAATGSLEAEWVWSLLGGAEGAQAWLRVVWPQARASADVRIPVPASLDAILAIGNYGGSVFLAKSPPGELPPPRGAVQVELDPEDTALQTIRAVGLALRAA